MHLLDIENKYLKYGEAKGHKNCVYILIMLVMIILFQSSHGIYVTIHNISFDNNTGTLNLS